jgi:ankyrin repeat protein
MLPLHRALLEVAPLGAVKLLVQADPATIQIPDNHGALPSHIACEYHECPDVVKYLVGLYTRSLLVADNRGNTPLHCACLAVNYDVIEMILLQYPNAPVDVRNLNLNDGNGDGNGDLPIQILLGYDDDESVGYASCIYLLLRANPEMWMSNENLVLALTSDS